MTLDELIAHTGAEVVAGQLQVRRGKEYIVLGHVQGTSFVRTPEGETLVRELEAGEPGEPEELPEPPRRGRPPKAKTHALEFDDEIGLGDKLTP